MILSAVDVLLHSQSLGSDYHIQVILPLALRGTFTYRVPEQLIEELDVGKRVVVPFGKKRYYAGLVYKLNVQVPRGTKPKDVSYVMDDVPIVTEDQLTFWEWMSFYYISSLGSVMNTALPRAMKISSKTMVSLNPEFEEYPELDEVETMVVAQLNTHESMGIEQLESLDVKRKMQRAVNRLLKIGLLVITEEIKEQVRPRTVSELTLSSEYHQEKSLSNLLDSLGKAPKQFTILMRYLEMTGGEFVPVRKNLLLERSGASSQILRALLDKGVFDEADVIAGYENPHEVGGYELNTDQLQAFQSLKAQSDKPAALLHGITGSGKTLIYTELIKEVQAVGKQVLYLVPEIALTTQLVDRLQKLIGAEMLVYHSRFSDKDRLTTWLRLIDSMDNEIIIGARSALFLPMNNLGLIIVDEEQEQSFKQHESAPHYNARDAAVWLGNKHGCQVILGSATPSIESTFNAKSGKYGYAELKKRYSNIPLPSIELVDMTKSKRADLDKTRFSGDLVEAMRGTLAKKKQVILFQNRRGFAPYMLCESCGWSAECVNCDVNLTYHKHFDKMLCHYCGYNLKLPKNCPHCGSAKMTLKGFGTEKIEDELEILFPEARIGRMDLDTTRKKNAFQNLITAFEEGSIDILVGTQMVTKGLDFQNVGLVGVLNADALWNRPDFRAFERTFQLLTQVAGRAGRSGARGRVMIQTFKMNHPILQYVINHDYDGYYTHQISERQSFKYPPFIRLIKFELAHPDAVLNREGAKYFSRLLRETFGDAVLGPEEPPIPRLRGKYLRHIFLKVPSKSSATQVRDAIWRSIDFLEGHETFRRIRLDVDVDTY